MAFSNWGAARRVALAALLIGGLAGCSSLPKLGPFGGGKPRPATEPTEAELAASAEALAEQPLVVMPNPYDEGAQSVPAAVASRFAEGRAALAAKRFEQARDIFAEMAANYPLLSGPQVNLAIAKWRLGDVAGAGDAFAAAIAANRLNGDAYTQWGLMAREAGDFERAQSLYQQALDVWPHNFDAHINLGILQDLYMGRLTDALAHYQMAARIAGEPTRELQGWIIDLERRLAEAG